MAGFVATAGCMSFAHAAPINYGNRSGDNVDFTNIQEDSGSDPTPLYGSPTVNDDVLKFQPPAAFSSSSTSGSPTADTTDGMLRFTVQAHEGQFIQNITLFEFGDFSMVVASPTGSAITSANGALFGTRGQPNKRFIVNRSNPPTASPGSENSPFLQVGPGSTRDTFTGGATLDYSGQQVRSVDISIDNTLQSGVSGEGSSAFIEKKGLDITVQTPEPASLALMAAGGLLLLPTRRRRKGRM